MSIDYMDIDDLTIEDIKDNVVLPKSLLGFNLTMSLVDDGLTVSELSDDGNTIDIRLSKQTIREVHESGGRPLSKVVHGLFCHEMGHIFEDSFNHQALDRVDHEIENMASDCAINWKIKMGEGNEVGLRGPKLGLPDFLSTEEYVKLIQQQLEDNAPKVEASPMSDGGQVENDPNQDKDDDDKDSGNNQSNGDSQSNGQGDESRDESNSQNNGQDDSQDSDGQDNQSQSGNNGSGGDDQGATDDQEGQGSDSDDNHQDDSSQDGEGNNSGDGQDSGNDDQSQSDSGNDGHQEGDQQNSMTSNGGGHGHGENHSPCGSGMSNALRKAVRERAREISNGLTEDEKQQLSQNLQIDAMNNNGAGDQLSEYVNPYVAMAMSSMIQQAHPQLGQVLEHIQNVAKQIDMSKDLSTQRVSTWKKQRRGFDHLSKEVLMPARIRGNETAELKQVGHVIPFFVDCSGSTHWNGLKDTSFDWDALAAKVRLIAAPCFVRIDQIRKQVQDYMNTDEYRAWSNRSALVDFISTTQAMSQVSGDQLKKRGVYLGELIWAVLLKARETGRVIAIPYGSRCRGIIKADADLDPVELVKVLSRIGGGTDTGDCVEYAIKNNTTYKIIKENEPFIILSDGEDSFSFFEEPKVSSKSLTVLIEERPYDDDVPLRAEVSINKPGFCRG